MNKNKMATIFAMFLMFAMSTMLVIVPLANAHDPAWEIVSTAYCVPAPNPVGQGQQVFIVMWVDRPMPSASVSNDIRRHDYKLTITDPDNETEVMEWPIVTDSTSIQYVTYIPTKVGIYTLLFEYAGQEYTWGGSFQGDTFLPDSRETTFTVQEEPLPEATTSYPLPTEYWTRPIEGQNTDWWSISSNWLGAPSIPGAGASYGIPGGIQLEGSAPNSAHVMWSKPIQDGGVVGGSHYHANGTTYYMGGSYNTRASNSLIMHGRLYYELPWGNAGTGGGWMCVDLRTGEEIWGPMDFGTALQTFCFGSFCFSFESPITPSFGYLYDYDMYNQHGIVPSNGWLFSSNFGFAIDPLSGRVADLNITNVPSGLEVLGPHGEHLRYVWDRTGQWLAQWNSSKVFTTQDSGTRDAGTANRYDWNVSIPLFPSGSSLRYAEVDNILLVSNIAQEFGSGFASWGTNDPYTVGAISLDPDSRGQQVFMKDYAAPEGEVSRQLVAWDPDNNVFIMHDTESLEHYGYSLTNGNLLWGPTDPTNDYTYFRQTTMVAYGKAYFAGYGGVVYCYDTASGDLLWTYGNGGEGNSTFAGLETAWGTYPVFVDVIADGKLYLATTEHSPNSPYYKDVQYRCLNATTGEELWTLMGWGTGMDAGCDVAADGFFVFLNCYDMQLYCIGKGPSATTVTASPKISVEGDSVLVEGFVTDIAAGTSQDEQAARFPNGVPAVSDESMGDWMEYVYMQKPKPAEVTGVEVILYVLDPNSNYYEVGRTTSDENGFFSCMFEPEVPGKYTVIANFEGSESYWPSHAVTAINVEEAPSATPMPTPEPESVADMYFVPMSVGMIIAIVVVGLLIILMLRKR